MKMLGMSVIIFLVVIAIGYASCAQIPIETTTNGKHVGVVTAVETNGFIFPTTSIYVKTDAQSSQEDRYCIDIYSGYGQSLREKAERFAQNRTRVEIRYFDYFARGIQHCSKQDIAMIQDIVPVEEG
jgi:hypothetical protein